MCLRYKTCALWIQGHYIVKDSTQNHLNWYKTQLVFPACPWFHFFRGPDKAYTAALPSGMKMAIVQQRNVKIMYMRTYNWVNCLIWFSSGVNINFYVSKLPFKLCWLLPHAPKQMGSFVSFSAWQLVAFCFSIRAVIPSSSERNSRTGKWCCGACRKCWTHAERRW